jgi:vacuolar-type H+-ATPase subunit F/Vma7
MPQAVFIGDEIAAAGYRLAGVRIYACDPSAVRALFDRLLMEHPPLLLIGESCVDLIGASRVHTAVTQAQPPVLVVADIYGQSGRDDIPESIRAVLGVTV